MEQKQPGSDEGIPPANKQCCVTLLPATEPELLVHLRESYDYVKETDFSGTELTSAVQKDLRTAQMG